MDQKQDYYYEIKPQNGLLNLNFGEIWRYKELLYVFAWRDIKVRYKQTILGIAWAIFQPFTTMIIFSFFFGKLAKIPSDGVPYPIFVYSGLLFWSYFSSSLTNASNCLITEENIIKKVYFPRLILPISSAITPMIDFMFSFLVLLGLMIFYKLSFNILTILLLPILLLISLMVASGLGLFLTSLNAKYRDVRYILPFFIQIIMYITPVIYPVSIIPSHLKWISYLNPLSGVITTARTLLLGTSDLNISTILSSLGVSFIYLIIGIMYFKKVEKFFADIL